MVLPPPPQQGVLCEHGDCRAKIHVHCQMKYFSKSSTRKCIQCKRDWKTALPGEEVASGDRHGKPAWLCLFFSDGPIASVPAIAAVFF